jgi:hypothetical protein
MIFQLSLITLQNWFNNDQSYVQRLIIKKNFEK